MRGAIGTRRFRDARGVDRANRSRNARALGGRDRDHDERRRRGVRSLPLCRRADRLATASGARATPPPSEPASQELETDGAPAVERADPPALAGDLRQDVETFGSLDTCVAQHTAIESRGRRCRARDRLRHAPSRCVSHAPSDEAEGPRPLRSHRGQRSSASVRGHPGNVTARRRQVPVGCIGGQALRARPHVPRGRDARPSICAAELATRSRPAKRSRRATPRDARRATATDERASANFERVKKPLRRA